MRRRREGLRERRGGRQWINSQSTAEQEQAELKELEATEEGERRRRREGSARVSQHLIKQKETTAAAARFEGTAEGPRQAALSEWVPRGRRGGSHDVLPTAARFSSHSPGGAIVRKEPQGTRRSALAQSF